MSKIVPNLKKSKTLSILNCHKPLIVYIKLTWLNLCLEGKMHLKSWDHIGVQPTSEAVFMNSSVNYARWAYGEFKPVSLRTWNPYRTTDYTNMRCTVLLFCAPHCSHVCLKCQSVFMNSNYHWQQFDAGQEGVKDVLTFVEPCKACEICIWNWLPGVKRKLIRSQAFWTI